MCSFRLRRSQTPYLRKPVTRCWNGNSGSLSSTFESNNADSRWFSKHKQRLSTLSQTVERDRVCQARLHAALWIRKKVCDSEGTTVAVWAVSATVTSRQSSNDQVCQRGVVEFSDGDASLLDGIYTNCSLRQNVCTVFSSVRERYRVLSVISHLQWHLMSSVPHVSGWSSGG